VIGTLTYRACGLAVDRRLIAYFTAGEIRSLPDASERLVGKTAAAGAKEEHAEEHRAASGEEAPGV
jgi:hypothetical protein